MKERLNKKGNERWMGKYVHEKRKKEKGKNKGRETRMKGNNYIKMEEMKEEKRKREKESEKDTLR